MMRNQLRLIRQEIMVLARSRIALGAIILFVLVSAGSIVSQMPGFFAREQLPPLLRSEPKIVVLPGSPTVSELATFHAILSFLNPVSRRMPALLLDSPHVRRYRTLDLFHQRRGPPWNFALSHLPDLYLVLLLPIVGLLLGAVLGMGDPRLRLSLLGLPLRSIQVITAKLAASCLVAAVPLLCVFIVSLLILAFTPAGIQSEVGYRLGYFYLASYLYTLIFAAIGLFFAVLLPDRRTALVVGLTAIVVLILVAPAVQGIANHISVRVGAAARARGEIPTRLLAHDIIRFMINTPAILTDSIFYALLSPEHSHHLYLGMMGGRDINFPISRALGTVARHATPLLWWLTALWGGTIIASLARRR